MSEINRGGGGVGYQDTLCQDIQFLSRPNADTVHWALSDELF